MGLGLVMSRARAQAAKPAAMRLNEPGPEAMAMAQHLGRWDVIETEWEAPGATPVVTTGLVAERRMFGTMFEEVLLETPASGATPDAAARSAGVRRIDYLHYNRVEGRWDYVSMDMRAPVGIMSAWSFDAGENGRIDLAFAPFSIPGRGTAVTGQMLRMTQSIFFGQPDQDVKDQYFLLADGTGTKWLAHRYAYTRR